MKIRALGAELFHVDGDRQTDRHDEANSRNSQFYERALELCHAHRRRFIARS